MLIINKVQSVARLVTASSSTTSPNGPKQSPGCPFFHQIPFLFWVSQSEDYQGVHNAQNDAANLPCAAGTGETTRCLGHRSQHARSLNVQGYDARKRKAVTARCVYRSRRKRRAPEMYCRVALDLPASLEFEGTGAAWRS